MFKIIAMCTNLRCGWRIKGDTSISSDVKAGRLTFDDVLRAISAHVEKTNHKVTFSGEADPE